MLSVERVKELLNDPKLSDKEVEEIRDGFLILAEIIYDRWLETIEQAKNQDEKENGESVHHK
ncbi:hypothetical protein KJ784_04340 [Patescibacteria group bacterium]|nr:hypothetical protein [Patescibacteria group bacterium]